MAYIGLRQTSAQVGRRNDRPNFRGHAAPAKHLRGVYGRNAEADVADVAVGREILIGEDYLAHAAISVEHVLNCGGAAAGTSD